MGKAGNGAFTLLMEAAVDPGGGDPGWPGLVDFLSAVGLSDAPLERVLTLLASEDVTNLAQLRQCFSALSPQLKAGPARATLSQVRSPPSRPAYSPAGH